MTLVLFASIPLVILMFFGRKVSRNTKLWLSVLSIPFFLIVMYFALILGVALVIAFLGLYQIQKWRLGKKQKRQPIEIIYNNPKDY